MQNESVRPERMNDGQSSVTVPIPFVRFRTMFTAFINGVEQLSWRQQAGLFCLLFWVVTFLCSLPEETGLKGFTVNQLLEDFGVFLLFTALWSGVHAHFKRSITLPWICLVFAVALWQEEVNLLNKTYQTVNLWFDRVIESDERQRGDVFTLAFVGVSLLLRLIFQRGFKSFWRLHITCFILLFTVFQLWLHWTFPYQMQSAIMAAQLDYQKEFTSTYEGRFRYQCDQGKWECYSWSGNEIPRPLLSNQRLVDLIRNHEGVYMNTDGFVGYVPVEGRSVFRGVDAAQKYIVTYFKNQDLNRVVLNQGFAQQATSAVTLPLLIFSTSFGMVWFFGGLLIVLMHQQRHRAMRNRP